MDESCILRNPKIRLDGATLPCRKSNLKFRDFGTSDAGFVQSRTFRATMLSQEPYRLLPSGRPVSNSGNPFLPGAKRATKENPVFVLRTVPKDSAAAMVAGRRQGMDCTLKAVENVSCSAKSNLKGLVVAVAANFTGSHRTWLLFLANACDCERSWFGESRR